MTREEVQDLMAMAQGIFSSFKPANKTITVNAWHMFFEDIPAELVVKAFKIFCMSDTSGFAPTPAQLIAIIQETEKEQIGELEAWSMVRKATRNGIYHAEEEYEKLPEVVKVAVGSPENIREWAMKDSAEVETVIMSQFLRSLRVAEQRMNKADFFPEYRPKLETKSVPEIEVKEERETSNATDKVFEVMKKLEKN